MPATPSVMSLHLCYRLWIAELNFDINVLRIFGEYLTELKNRKEGEGKSKTDYFEKQFVVLRKENDELRHEMQLSKMKLGAHVRDGRPLDYKQFSKENHVPIRKRLAAYKAGFKKIKTEFN
jgi:hypothetical protein